MEKVVEVKLRSFEGILQRDQILSLERRIVQKVFPILGLDVEATRFS